LYEPKNYRAIMLSSTFTDLREHRQKVIEAIDRLGYMPKVMERSGARARVDVIESSLNMVRDSAAYFCVIGLKYGQTPVDPDRNPRRLSITQLEFNEAVRLGRPIVLFIMGDEHPVKKADVESDPEKRKKLDSFRESAKSIDGDSGVQRVYEMFESLEQFSSAAAVAVGNLIQQLRPKQGQGFETGDASGGNLTLPRPPELAALPQYLGSHPFVGRKSELEKLTNWCAATDPNPMLLFEAIGGSGKSMLTWEWLTKHATKARSDWAGRFWYSFYEEGAVMADFCRQALAYVTRKSDRDFAKLRTTELSRYLLAELQKRPWLLVLDGLERVLVAYHRHDAAQIRDDEADTANDQIGARDPRGAIRPEDDILLRQLTTAAPSKILVSSRLTPLALFNRSKVPVPGVHREFLPGLRPADAEAMIRNCGVAGDSEAIRAYLQINCGCHPLVVGVLAGLINDYPADRGNFDRWAADPRYGGALNLAKLDLTQRRNHILLAAISALQPESRQLLQTLALLQSGAAFETLRAFNPHLPTRAATAEPALGSTIHDFPIGAADAELALGNTIGDLERRGLVQYDSGGKRYDMHPVVRGVAAGRMAQQETQELGRKVVDHFSVRLLPYREGAETLADVEPRLHIVRVLLRMLRYGEALDAYRRHLAVTLNFNLGASAEIQMLLRPFFPDGWDAEPVSVSLDKDQLSYVLNEAALSMQDSFPDQAERLLERKILLNAGTGNLASLATGVRNLARILRGTNRLADAARLRLLAVEIAEKTFAKPEIFSSKLHLYSLLSECGDWQKADDLWQELKGLRPSYATETYRSGDAQHWRAVNLFYRGQLTEHFVSEAERLAKPGNRTTIQSLCVLRGEWHLSRDQFVSAADNLTNAVRMAREVGAEDLNSEALLALCRFLGNETFDVRGEAERLGRSAERAALALARLWHALGERDRAVEYGLRAYRWSVADGEPYVHRYYLDQTRALLVALGCDPPDVPHYDFSSEKLYAFERDIPAVFDRRRAKQDEWPDIFAKLKDFTIKDAGDN
jgi:tetratricopeptide (TPR) repeat protein